MCARAGCVRANNDRQPFFVHPTFPLSLCRAFHPGRSKKRYQELLDEPDTLLVVGEFRLLVFERAHGVLNVHWLGGLVWIERHTMFCGAWTCCWPPLGVSSLIVFPITTPPPPFLPRIQLLLSYCWLDLTSVATRDGSFVALTFADGMVIEFYASGMDRHWLHRN